MLERLTDHLQTDLLVAGCLLVQAALPVLFARWRLTERSRTILFLGGGGLMLLAAIVLGLIFGHRVGGTILMIGSGTYLVLAMTFPTPPA